MTQKHPTLGVIFALTAALLFGLNASTTKVIIQSGLSAEQVVFIRSMFSATIALIWALIANRSALRVKAKQIPPLLLLGVVGVGALQWTYSLAVVKLPVGIALLIEYTAVLWVPIIMMLFFSESVKKQIWLGAALVLGGLAVVGQVWDSTLNPEGVLWGIAAAASLTFYFISGERIQRNLPTNVTMFYGMTTATLLFLPFANWPAFDFASLGTQLDLTGNLSGTELPLWVLLVWMGVMGSFLPMAFSYLALRHLSATIVGIIATSETVLAFLFALLWLGEVITFTQTLGGIVVVLGILLAQTARKQKTLETVE
ncbi:DMT family transporter [Aquiluna sp. KACHI24]|uniref:EamA family transporter n=1 Tax=Aquiluna sp. KACHI24 TaxID=2968831 RepID=UPI002205DC9C|nr:DMT family transporter [Aquiluna sp. KACHI24]BDQ00457.1 permease [Aquiluna sp. KACHI24]